jgi:hypothetical protein
VNQLAFCDQEMVRLVMTPEDHDSDEAECLELGDLLWA